MYEEILSSVGCELHMIILICSFSEGRSIIYEIFFLQREINEVTDSSSLYLKASNSLLKASMMVLNVNCLKNSYAKPSKVVWRDTSNEVNQRWVTLLRDIGKSITIWDSSNLWALITVL